MTKLQTWKIENTENLPDNTTLDDIAIIGMFILWSCSQREVTSPSSVLTITYKNNQYGRYLGHQTNLLNIQGVERKLSLHHTSYYYIEYPSYRLKQIYQS